MVVLIFGSIALGGYGTSTAEAHRLHKGKHETNLHFANRVVRHAQTGISWIKSHRRNYKFPGLYEDALRNHRWLLKYGRYLQAKYSSYVRTYYPPHYSEWMCIHHYEGAWNDPNAPYYGGLQMDWGFMRNYGSWLLKSKGTADHWTPLEQMWVAERGLAVQGWYAWPNTARMCGLL